MPSPEDSEDTDEDIDLDGLDDEDLDLEDISLDDGQDIPEDISIEDQDETAEEPEEQGKGSKTKQKSKSHSELPKLDPNHLVEKKKETDISTKDKENKNAEKTVEEPKNKQNKQKLDKNKNESSEPSITQSEPAKTEENKTQKVESEEQETKIERPAPPAYEKKYFEKGENALFLKRDICKDLFRCLKEVKAHTRAVKDLTTDNIKDEEQEIDIYAEIMSDFSDLQVELLELDATIFSGEES